MQTLQKETLRKGKVLTALSIGIGECLFGVNEPLLFHGLGLTAAQSICVGCLVGAAAGLGFGWLYVHYLSRLTPARLFRKDGIHQPPH